MPPLENFKKILVIQTAFLGDVILCIPLLKTIRKFYPSARIALLTRNGLSPLLSATGVVDEIIEVDKKSRASRKKAFLRAKEFSPELIISPHQSFRTALWTRLLRPKLSVGLTRWNNFFGFTKGNKRDPKLHDVLRQLSVLKALGIEESDWIKELKVEIPSSNEFHKFKGAIALSPGSQWNTKQWTIEGFSGVGNHFKGRKVLILGAPNEKELADELSLLIPHAINLCGHTNLIEMAQILKQCSVLFANDSGATHIASLVGLPVVTVFGPTVPSQGYGPWNPRSAIVEVSLPCRPCGAHGHNKCPIGTHDCMKKVTSSMVIEKYRELFKE